MNRGAPAALLAITLAIALSHAAIAQVSIEPVRGCFGRLVLDAATGAAHFSRVDDASSLQVVYNAFTAPMNFGISSSNNAVVWGDSVLLVRSGTLDEIVLNLYNSLGSYATLDSASLAVQIEDPATNSLLGSWTMRADFVPYGGLPNGYYVLLGISGLSAQPVSVGGWLVVKQRVLSSPGYPFAGLGVASLSPPGVGSSPPSMYSSDTPGFFTISGTPADLGYRLVADVVDATTPVSWGRLKHLYR